MDQTKGMKNKFSISRYTYLIYGFLFLLSFLMIIPKITVSIKDDSNSNAYKGIEIIDKDVYIINNSKEKINITLPHTAKNVQKNQEFDIFIDLSKFADLSNKSIGIQLKYADLKISADGKTFFELNTPKNYIPKSGGGYGYYIIDLPKDMKSKSIVLHLTPNLNMKFDYRLNKIDIGYRNSFFINMLIQDSSGIIFSFIYIIIFIMTFIMAYIGRKNDYFFKKLINTGLSSITFALYFLSRYKTITYIFTDYRNILYFTQYFTFILILYSILKIISEVVTPKLVCLLNIVKHSILIIYVIRLLLTFFGVLEFKELYQIDNIFMLSVTILVICSSFFIREVKYESKKTILTTFILIAVVILTCFYNYIMTSQVSLSLSSSLSMLIFLLYQIYESINVYKKIIQENTDLYIYENLLLYDSLTSLGSRYAYEKKLKQISENEYTTTIITVDVNNLKIINDELGHAMGDIAIKSVGNYLESNIPDSEVYRIGGDEFIAIYLGIIQEEFFNNLNRNLFVKGISEKIDVSFSLGFSYYIPKSETSLDEAIKISDKNMYKEKNSLNNESDWR